MVHLQIRCKHCRRLVPANPRLKKQEYCGQKQCQQARKNEWRRQQRETDPSYCQGERESREKWIENNPEYNRPQDGKKSTVQKPISRENSTHGRKTKEQKRDALASVLNDKTRDYIISYLNPETGKRDALKVNIIVLSTN